MNGGFWIYLIIILFGIARMANSKNRKTSEKGSARTAARRPSGKTPLASDGHRVPKDQDISCRRYGHKHEEFDRPRFIPHEDPEEGYIILNGVKMKITEADRYEERI